MLMQKIKNALLKINFLSTWYIKKHKPEYVYVWEYRHMIWQKHEAVQYHDKTMQVRRQERLHFQEDPLKDLSNFYSTVSYHKVRALGWLYWLGGIKRVIVFIGICYVFYNSLTFISKKIMTSSTEFEMFLLSLGSFALGFANLGIIYLLLCEFDRYMHKVHIKDDRF